MTAEPPIEIELTAPVQGGQNLGRLDGQVIFVQGGVPGERVQLVVRGRKRGYLEAEALSVAAPSAARVAPPCPYFGENGQRRGALNGVHTPGGVCGGCQYQHLNYQGQLALKGQVLRDVLRRVGKILDAPVADPIGSPHPYAYRNKASWLITEDGETAYHQARSHSPVPVESCHLLVPGLEAIRHALRDVAPDVGLAGLVRVVEARLLPDGQGGERGTLVLELPASTGTEEAQELAATLLDLCPAVLGVVGMRGHEAGAQILAGTPRLETPFLDELLTVSATSFFQVNLPVAEMIAKLALQHLGGAGRQVLDVYAGVGTFTIPLARIADAVIAIELDDGAVADLRETIARLGLDNITILAGDAATGLRSILPGTMIGAVIDPPRAGCSPEVLRQLIKIKAPRLVYVSCDAATLARDLRVLLDAGYELESVQPFDLFPQTAHIESVSLLRLPRKFQVRR